MSAQRGPAAGRRQGRAPPVAPRGVRRALDRAARPGAPPGRRRPPPGVDECVVYTGPASARVVADDVAYLALTGRTGAGASTGRAHLLALSRTTSDCLITIDTDSVVRFVNPAVEWLFGYHPSEVVGEPLTELMAPELGARHREGLRRYLSTGERALDRGPSNSPADRRTDARFPSRCRSASSGPTASDGLYALDAASRSVAVNDAYLDLVEARSAAEICERVVDTGVNVVGIPGVAVYLHDEADGRLRPEATSSGSQPSPGQSEGWLD